MRKILLIGCGHMGSALLTSWIKTKEYSIIVVDPEKNKFLKQKYKKNKVKIYKSFYELKNKTKFDIVVFAMKPKDLNDAIKEMINIKIDSNTSIISVLAGKKISIFRKKFVNTKNIFRVMPNMPASIGESMNCVVANKFAAKIKKKQIMKLFSYSGKTILLKNENQIDMATAISGSGPGFVFNIIDLMENAAINLGFSSSISKSLVLQTFHGSISLLSKNKISAKDLVSKVATKGGTTEAGLNVMKKNKLQKIFNNLVKASYKKAKDQGR